MIRPRILITRRLARPLVCAVAMLAATATMLGMFAHRSAASAWEVERGLPPYTVRYTGSAPADGTPTGEKTVHLTFDDGPSKFTPQVLEILARYGVPATFFVVGNTPYTAYMKDIVAAGHAIGLHSYSHEFGQIYRSEDAFFADLAKLDGVVFEQTGIHSTLMRFPGGSSVKRGTTRARMNRLCALVEERGYQYFDWNCETGDAAGTRTVSGAMAHIRAAAKEYKDDSVIVVLMHDTQKLAVNALPEVIEYFQAQGMRFGVLAPETPAVHHSW